MQMQSVESQLLSHIGFDSEAGTIAVTFKRDGVTYHYPADETTFAAFNAAESKGSHFLKHIKPLGHSAKFTPEEIANGAR